MATVETTDIRGLDVDKMIKGFALTEYIFKNMVSNSTTDGDSVRWYKETAADLTLTSPSQLETSPLSQFENAEVTWTRHTSYPKKYAVEGTISREDIKSADIDVLARTILRLVRAVVKKVDSVIYNVMSEDQSPSTIGTAAATGNGWDDTSNGNPILDIMAGLQNIAENDYDTSGCIVAMNPKNYKDLLNYVITVKGSSIPAFSSDKVVTGVVGTLVGCRLVVSNNVVADSVWMGLPAKAVTWKAFESLHSETENIMGKGTKIAVWENGVAILTDPKAAYLITDTDA
jgi:hypothetical protein|tara:strand:+ start:621 stop:1481 length:861 start_codon:yes stop_codon:yes gene_type:complete